MPPPVIGAIMFVVVTQSSRVAANRARSLRLGPYQPSGGLLPSRISVPAGVLAGFCPASDTRHTHARVHAHGLALTHLVSTKSTASLGLGVRGEGRGGGGGGCLVCLWGVFCPAQGPDYLMLRQAWGVPILIGRFFRCCLLPSRICH